MKRTITKSEVLHELESLKKKEYRDPIMIVIRKEVDAIIDRLELKPVILKKVNKEEPHKLNSVAEITSLPV